MLLGNRSDTAPGLRDASPWGGGAAHRANGAKVTLGLVANTVVPGTTLWHVSYQDDKYKELFHIAIEGETGKLKVPSD